MTNTRMLLALSLVAMLAEAGIAQDQPKLRKEEAAEIATAAYING
jgi:hypothetical protein